MVSLISVLTFLVVVSISSLIVRVGAVALKLTGMSSGAARFQARSAFLGVGFTTTESEEVVGHPLRREIVMRLMLAGNVGAVSVLGTLLVSALQVRDRAEGLVCSLIVVAGLVLFGLLRRSRSFSVLLTRSISRMLRRYTSVGEDASHGVGGALIHRCSDDFRVSSLPVASASPWVGTHIQDLRLAGSGLRVLGVERVDGSYLDVDSVDRRPGDEVDSGQFHGDGALAVGDRLLVYGPTRSFAECLRAPV